MEDSDQIPDVRQPELEEDGEEWSEFFDELDGPAETFQKYYTKVLDKFKCRKRRKAKKKSKNELNAAGEQKEDAKLETESETKVDVKTGTSVPEVNVDEHEYNFYHPERGLAIIINNEIFKPEAKMKDRTGSASDAKAMEVVFKKLGFKIRHYKNLTVQQMVAVLNKAASNTEWDHTNADCFACAILSHGGEEKKLDPKKKGRNDPKIRNDVVFGVEGKMVHTRYLLSVFNDECCPELEGKPRLFFIQACRGDNLDSGKSMAYFRPKKGKPAKPRRVNTTDKDHRDDGGGDYDSDSDSEYKDAEEYPPQTSDDKSTATQPGEEIIHDRRSAGEQPADKDRRTPVNMQEAQNASKSGDCEHDGLKLGLMKSSKMSSITVSPSPIYKDFLLMYAAPPGHFAWRRETGGWLIQTLKQVFISSDPSTTSLTSLLTKVSRKVATDYISKSSKAYLNQNKLVPCIMSMLTKDVYFRHKQ